MGMKPEPLVAAIEAVAGPKGPERRQKKTRVLLMSPQGERLDQELLDELAKEETLVLVSKRLSK